MIPLNELHPGQVGQVVEIQSQDSQRLLKLSALGLVPGSLIRLQQRVPAYVIWVGETQLSFDDAIAREIILRPR